MPGSGDDLYSGINAHHATILSYVVLRWTDRRMAEALNIEVSSVRTHLRRLRQRASVRSKDELREWWLAHRTAWLESMALAAGIEWSVAE